MAAVAAWGLAAPVRVGDVLAAPARNGLLGSVGAAVVGDARVVADAGLAGAVAGRLTTRLDGAALHCAPDSISNRMNLLLLVRDEMAGWADMHKCMASWHLNMGCALWA